MGPLVDAHVHLYADQEAGQQAKDRYVIWEYGDDPGVEFAPMAGDLDDLAATYGKAGFDRAVVVHLFDAALAREEAMARLTPGTANAAQPQDEAMGHRTPGTANASPSRDEGTVRTTPRPNTDKALADVDHAVAEAMLASNRWVAEVARANPLVEVLVCVDPTVLSPAALVAHITELADGGVRGIKLHPVSQGYRPDDPRLHPIYETCADAGLVVLSHSGPGHHHGASAQPSDFIPVLERWPQLRLVLAHLGGATWREAEAVAATFPQVVFDLSEIIEWTGARSAPTAAELAALIQSIGADRVMLGSDFPWYDPARTVDRVMSLPGLGPEEHAAILGGTAVQVLSLDG